MFSVQVIFEESEAFLNDLDKTVYIWDDKPVRRQLVIQMAYQYANNVNHFI